MARPNSIKAIGLKKYLDITKEKHNGFGYEAFNKMMNLEKRPAVASIAKIFGVTDQTVQKWILHYEHE